MRKKDFGGLALLIMSLAVVSCEIKDNELGVDLLPPGDNVLVYHDTIFEIDAYPVSARPEVISENRLSPNVNRLMLLGGVEDTIVGRSEASIVTQFNTTPSFKAAANTEIDSLLLTLYVYDVLGTQDQEIELSVYEFTERIYMDSAYYTDFDMEGKFRPLPLVQKTVQPEAGGTINLLIEDPDFINKFLAIQEDTSYFGTSSDSLFKDYFNGFYITATTTSPGSMLRLQLNNTVSRLGMKFANDSTEVDSTLERDYNWAFFAINQFSTQKINIFEHDHSGTYLEEILDQPDAASPYLYVQGMTGVKTRFSFTSLEEWIARNPIIINSAVLVLDVVPESESGIPYADLPERMILATLNGDIYEPVYDYLVQLSGDGSLDEAPGFGGYIRSRSDGLFSDTTYTCRFNIGLHFQAMLDGAETANDFLVDLKDGLVNPKVSKFWSNLSPDEQRIRLEIVYLKL